jgi:hypothetical protein
MRQTANAVCHIPCCSSCFIRAVPMSCKAILINCFIPLRSIHCLSLPICSPPTANIYVATAGRTSLYFFCKTSALLQSSKKVGRRFVIKAATAALFLTASSAWRWWRRSHIRRTSSCVSRPPGKSVEYYSTIVIATILMKSYHTVRIIFITNSAECDR